MERLTQLRTVALIGMVGLLGVACDDEEPEAGDSDAPPSAEEIRGTPAAPAAPPEPPSDGPGPEPATASATETGEAPAETGAPRTEPLYAVQLGAFTRDPNATRLRQRLDSAELPVWTSTTEISGRRFTRVRVGATATVAEARRVMARLEEAFDGEAWVAPVAPDAPLPADVREATATLLGEGR